LERLLTKGTGEGFLLARLADNVKPKVIKTGEQFKAMNTFKRLLFC